VKYINLGEMIIRIDGLVYASKEKSKEQANIRADTFYDIDLQYDNCNKKLSFKNVSVRDDVYNMIVRELLA
jgi:ABC-type uncharacterized transport system fused permease/ATPase subunit